MRSHLHHYQLVIHLCKLKHRAKKGPAQGRMGHLDPRSLCEPPFCLSKQYRIRFLETPKPCTWEKHLAGTGERMTLGEIRGRFLQLGLHTAHGNMQFSSAQATVFKSHLRASHMTLAFWWKCPNFSTELFFFSFHGTDGKIFISNNFMEEIVISTPFACVREVSYVSTKAAVCSLCSHLRCREDTLN